MELIPGLSPEKPAYEALNLTQEEAARRIDLVVERCERSDMYDRWSIYSAAWDIDDSYPTLERDQVPWEDVQQLGTALSLHPAASRLEHNQKVVRIVKPHDQEQFELHELGARILVLGLIDRLGVGAVISRDDLFSIAGQYGMLPEAPEEQDWFSRVFAYTDGVEIGEDGGVRLRALSSGPVKGAHLGALVGSSLLEKLDFAAVEPEQVPVQRASRRQRSRRQTTQPQSQPQLSNESRPKPTVPKRRLVMLKDFKREPLDEFPAEISDQHQALIELYKASLENQVKGRLEAAYDSWPPARVVTAHMLRMEMFMRNYPEMARPILDKLLAEDERFVPYEKRSMFMVVKPEASDNALAGLRKKIEYQRNLARRTADSLVYHVSRKQSYDRPLSFEKILTAAARIDQRAELSILYPFLRDDKRFRINKDEQWYVRRPDKDGNRR